MEKLPNINSLLFPTLRWSFLELWLQAVRRSKSPQEQFIIIIFKLCVMEIFTYIHTCRLLDRQNRQTDTQTDTSRQTDRQNSQTHRQNIDIQAGRQTHLYRHTY